MAEVAFYHLSRPFEAALPRLLERVVGQGHRVAIRVADPARRKQLDEHLWTWDAASFLPHGCEGEHAERQPVLLIEGDAAANGADVMVVTEGPLPRFAGRLLYFFDNATVEESRALWRGLGDEVERSYWQQDERGGWAKKA